MEVAALVREAGVAIGIGPEEPLLDEVIAALKKEYIVHDWQMAKLDSAQWRALGAPMGLAVAIQVMIEEEQEMNMPPHKGYHRNMEPERFPSSLTSRASHAIQENDQLTSSARSSNGSMAAIRKNPRKTMAKPSLFNRHATLQVMEGKNPVERAVDYRATEVANDDPEILRPETADTSSSSEQPQKPVEPKNGATCSLNNKKCCGKEVATCFSSMMKTELTVENTSCFVMSKVRLF